MCRIFGFSKEKWRFLKDRGGTHWSWPGGRGGRPRALVAGEGWGGGRGDGNSKKKGGLGLGWLLQRGMPPVGWGGVPTGAGLVDGEVDQDLIPGEGVREGLAWRGKAGWVPTTGAGCF